MEEILRIEGLSKHFKKVKAVDKLEFSVCKGQVFGLLGPNGSGKTTTLAMLLGILKPTEGSFSWFGNGQADENRLRIGTLLETPNFYPYLNAYDNLNVVAKIKKMDNAKERIDRVVEQVDLKDRGKRPFRTYSLGMKQRLAVASALLSDPEVLVLDEPTNGLDPLGIIEMRDLIISIAKEGKTIIIASHILDEIEKICSHVAILKDGKLLQNGTISSFMQHRNTYAISSGDLEKLKMLVPSIQGLHLVEATNGQLIVDVAPEISGSDLNKLFVEKGVYLSSLSSYQKSLETLFIEAVS